MSASRSVVPIDTELLAPELLLEWFQAPIAFHRPLIELVGGHVGAALMLTYALHCTREFVASGAAYAELAVQGYMQITQADWTRECGLSRWEQQSARRVLRDKGYIEERKSGLPAKLYFRVAMEHLVADLSAQAMRNLAAPSSAG